MFKWIVWNANFWRQARDFWEKTTESFSSKTDGKISYWLDPVLRAIPGQNEEKSPEIIVCKIKSLKNRRLKAKDIF